MGFDHFADIRAQFPVTRELIYLNHAAVSPLSLPAASAMRALTDDVLNWGSFHYDKWLAAYDGLRTAAARLIGSASDEIAIVKNTSEGISVIANGFDWNPGDRIVAFREEFPANYFPWLRLEQKGIVVTWLSIYDPLETIVDAVRGARLLAISFVNYLTGYRVDLRAIGEACQASNCFFFVDAIQGLGALPLNVEECRIDALAADGHKWLLGPEGNGILYVRRKWLDRINPVEFGWSNPANYSDFSSRDMTLRADAGRYECGTLNTVGCFGLQAAIEFLLEIGIGRVSELISARARQIAEGARGRGYELSVPFGASTSSGIVSFRHPSIDARVIVSDWKRHGILAAPRQGWVRTAPHLYITEQEIDRVLSLLPAV